MAPVTSQPDLTVGLQCSSSLLPSHRAAIKILLRLQFYHFTSQKNISSEEESQIFLTVKKCCYLRFRLIRARACRVLITDRRELKSTALCFLAVE